MQSQTPLTDEVRRILSFVVDYDCAMFYLSPSLRRAIRREQTKARQETDDQQDMTETSIPREESPDESALSAYCLTCEAPMQPYASQVHQNKSNYGADERDPRGFQHPQGSTRWCRHVPAKCYSERESPGRYGCESISKLIHRVQSLLHLIRGYVKSGLIHIVGT